MLTNSKYRKKYDFFIEDFKFEKKLGVNMYSAYESIPKIVVNDPYDIQVTALVNILEDGSAIFSISDNCEPQLPGSKYSRVNAPVFGFHLIPDPIDPN